MGCPHIAVGRAVEAATASGLVGSVGTVGGDGARKLNVVPGVALGGMATFSTK
jgi:hypothetical protein